MNDSELILSDEDSRLEEDITIDQAPYKESGFFLSLD